MRSARAFTYDYEPAPTVKDLALRADIVVAGTIQGVAPGQSYAPAADSEPEIATSVLAVLVEQVLEGDPSLVTDERVYIEIPHPAFVGTAPEDEEGGGPMEPFDHAVFAESVPIGLEGIFFLGDRTDEPYWDHIQSRGAGRPAGAPITQAHIQGFLIQADGGKLVSVFDSFDAMPEAWRDLNSLDDVRVALG